MEKKASYPRWIVPIAAVSLFAVLVAMSNREIKQDGITALQTDDDFNRVNTETQKKLADVLLRADAGQEISLTDREKLSSGVPVFQALADFKPTEMGPFFVLSKLYINLDKPNEAEEASRQGIYNGLAKMATLKVSKDSEEYRSLLTYYNETRLVHAQALFQQKQYANSVAELRNLLREANATPKDTARYLYQTSRGLIELKDYRTARLTLRDAIARDPEMTRAQDLLKFVETLPDTDADAAKKE